MYTISSEVVKIRKVELRMNEQVKYDVIKKLVETNGNKKRAAVTLGCTLRTVNRLIQRYKQEGKAALYPGYVTSLEERQLHEVCLCNGRARNRLGVLTNKRKAPDFRC